MFRLTCGGRKDGQWNPTLAHCLNKRDHLAHDVTGNNNPDMPPLYRATTVRTGEGRRTRTVTADELDYLRGAWYNGIRVTSSHRI